MPRLTMDQGEADSPPPRAHLLPAPLPSAPAALSLAHHGGFLSALPLVAEFLVGSDGPLSSLSLVRPPLEDQQHEHTLIQGYYTLAPGEQLFLGAAERALAVERARYTILLPLRLVAKSWRISATGYDRELRTVSTAATGDVVPFPLRCVRKLDISLIGVCDWNFPQVRGVLSSPSWLGNLVLLEDLHVHQYEHFHVPELPALPLLKRIYFDWSDFIESAEGIRDRKLEYIAFCPQHAKFKTEKPELYEAVARAFDGTACGQTLRELCFRGQPFTTLPEGLRDLRLTSLDISDTDVRELPEWLGNHPLVRLQLSVSSIETLPASLRACQSLRFLGLANTALGTALHCETFRNDQIGRVSMRLPGASIRRSRVPLSSVPASEIQRRTDELMAISLALPDLRISFDGEPRYAEDAARHWHARCGIPWTDPVFYLRH